MYEITFATAELRLMQPKRFGGLMTKLQIFSNAIQRALDLHEAKCTLKWEVRVEEPASQSAVLKVRVGIARNIAGPPHKNIVAGWPRELDIYEETYPTDAALEDTAQQFAYYFYEKSCE